MMSVPIADVHGDGNVQPMGHGEDAGGCMGRLAVVQKPANGLADPASRRDAVGDRFIQQAAGLLGHTEAPGAQRLVDILGGGAG